MAYILYETAQSFSILKTDDAEELSRSQSSSAALQHVTLHAQLPFATTDEAAELYQALLEPRYPESVVQFLRQHVPAKQTVLVQDVHLSKQLEDLRYRPQAAPAVFRVVRQHEAALVRAGQTSQAGAQDAYQASRALAHAASRLVCKFDKARSDQQVVQAIGYYETLVKDLNAQQMRLAEMLGLHFPELRRLVQDQDLFVLLAFHLGDRERVAAADPEQLVAAVRQQAAELELDRAADAEPLARAAIRQAPLSTGCRFEAPELGQLALVERRVHMVLLEKQRTARFIAEKLRSVAPNTLALLGGLNAARLLAKAGSLSRLAKAPASTVQLYGAEKALFRVLKRRSNRTPKYGLLFRSTHVQACRAPKARGRVARALACCAARCARVDYYAETPGEAYGAAMRELMDKRVEFYDGTLRGEMPRVDDVLRSLAKE